MGVVDVVGHIREHLDYKPITCTQCSDSFYTEQQKLQHTLFKGHYSIHKSAHQFATEPAPNANVTPEVVVDGCDMDWSTCHQCHKLVANNENDLWDHATINHAPIDFNLQCPVPHCNFHCSTTEVMRQHFCIEHAFQVPQPTICNFRNSLERLAYNCFGDRIGQVQRFAPTSSIRRLRHETQRPDTEETPTKNCTNSSTRAQNSIAPMELEQHIFNQALSSSFSQSPPADACSSEAIAPVKIKMGPNGAFIINASTLTTNYQSKSMPDSLVCAVCNFPVLNSVNVKFNHLKSAHASLLVPAQAKNKMLLVNTMDLLDEVVQRGLRKCFGSRAQENTADLCKLCPKAKPRLPQSLDSRKRHALLFHSSIPCEHCKYQLPTTNITVNGLLQNITQHYLAKHEDEYDGPELREYVSAKLEQIRHQCFPAYCNTTPIRKLKRSTHRFSNREGVATLQKYSKNQLWKGVTSGLVQQQDQTQAPSTASTKWPIALQPIVNPAPAATMGTDRTKSQMHAQPVTMQASHSPARPQSPTDIGPIQAQSHLSIKLELVDDDMY